MSETGLLALARLVGADWAVLQRNRTTSEVRRGAAGERRYAEGSVRDVDEGLLGTLDRGRIVRIGDTTLRRWPRTVGAGLREVLAYVHPKRPSDRFVAGLRCALSVEVGPVAALARRIVEGIDSPALAPEPRDACTTHDLRHLLTVASLELERARAESENADATRRAQAALDDALVLCDRSLSGRVARGRRDRHSLRVLLESAARDASLASLRAHKVEVRVSCAPDLAGEVDRVVFERALRNLLLNAIEASPDGSSVELAAAADGGDWIRVSVRDRGRGIASEDLPDLLRPGRSGSGGSGYGTASVRACVKELGGTLEVRSRPLAGTEFVLRLPRGA